MPSNSSEVTTVVIETKPGQAFVKIADPRPNPDQIEFFLHQTIRDWSKTHPNYSIDRLEKDIQKSQLMGIHIFYHQTNSSTPGAKVEGQPAGNGLVVEIHHQIIRSFPKEYLEAVIGDVREIHLNHADRIEPLLVVNRRRVAVVLDERVGRCAVLPLESLGTGIEDSLRASIQNWLNPSSESFYVTHIAGNFFNTE